jgi:transposase
VACRGGEASTRRGRYRWVIEPTIAWLVGYRRLTFRYERSAKAYCAFLTLAAALTCHKRYLKHAT